MVDIEDDSAQSMTLSEDVKKAKHENDTMESEDLQSSLQMAENTIMDVEIGNTVRIQETENKISSLTIESNFPSLSKIDDNESSLIPETDIGALVQEVKSQNPFHISRAEKTSKILSEDEELPRQKHTNYTIKSESLQQSSLQMAESTSPILDLENGDPAESQQNENKMSSLAIPSIMPTASKIHANQSSFKLETDIVKQLQVQEVKCQNPSHLSKAEKISKGVSKEEELPVQTHKNVATKSESLQPSSLQVVESTMSKILYLENGDPPESQQTENKISSLAVIPSIIPTLSKINANQSSFKSETDKIKLLQDKEVRRQVLLQLSKELQNKEQVGSKNVSPISVSQRDTQNKNLQSNSCFQLPQHITAKYLVFLENKLNKAPMLPLFAFKNNEEESKRNTSLLVLEFMEYVRSWLGKIEAHNEFYTKRYQELIVIVMRFGRLEEMVNEKRNFLSMGKSFSNLEQSKQSEYETFVYESLYSRGGDILHSLRDIKKRMDAAFIKYSESRVLYINSSIQIAVYPFEEKLHEGIKTLIALANKLSVLLDNTSVKLVQQWAFIYFFGYYYCSNRVRKYFNDIDALFSV